MQNEYLYNRNEVLQAIFNTLKDNEEFLNFGSKKVIFTTAMINDTEFSFHHNVLITNDTLFIEYYNEVKDKLNQYYEEGYPVDIIPVFKIRVWNMNMIENTKIKINQNNTLEKKKLHNILFHLIKLLIARIL